MGRSNSASPDHLSSGDDNANVSASGSGSGGLGFHSIRDHIRFKRNANPTTTTTTTSTDDTSNKERTKTSTSCPDRQWRGGARSHHHLHHHHHSRSAIRKLFRGGRSWFYFWIFFAVFVFAFASIVLQSSITSLFLPTGSDRGRFIRQGLKFGTSLNFVPSRMERGGGLDLLRSQPRIGVRPPRLGLILGNMEKDPLSLMLFTVMKNLQGLGYVLKIYATEDGKARSTWEKIGGQISVLDPARYGHIDWSIFEGIIVDSLEAKDAISRELIQVNGRYH